MKARISGRAQSDLDQIYAYIYVSQGCNAADRFLNLARQAAVFLIQHPHAGPHPGWATQHKNLRFWVISGTKFLLYYFVEGNEVRIERVLDGRRDVKRIVEQGVDDAPPAPDERSG